jgi:tetratricopeptide (TPR) repeat protein
MWRECTVNTVARPQQTELETLIAGSDNSPAALRGILNKLSTSRVFAVTNKPWDGRSVPRADMQLLLVSDGADQAQAMLALFSASEHARGVTDGDHAFKNVVEVDAAWAFLGVPEGAGILINPNSQEAPAFRIGSVVAAELKKYALHRLQSLIDRPAPINSDNSAAKPFVAEARELIAKNDFEAARGLIDKILVAAPNDNDALQLAGQIAIEEHRNADALNYFTAAVNTAPTRAAAAASMSGLGQALTWLRQYDQAEKTLLQAMQLDPQIMGPLRSLADMKVEKGEILEALDLYRRLTAMAPKVLGPYLKIAELLVDSGQAAEALAVYDTALTLESQNAWVHFCRAVALEALGRKEEALLGHLKARDLADRFLPPDVATEIQIGR